MPLYKYQACTPADDLQTSQGQNLFAHRVRKAYRYLKTGTWNVHSMADTDGPIEVASQRPDSQRGENRKVDQVVYELERYDVAVGTLQETKWFGNEVYKVDGNVVWTAGRATPAQGVAVQRGEGVVLVLRGLAVNA